MISEKQKSAQIIFLVRSINYMKTFCHYSKNLLAGGDPGAGGDLGAGATSSLQNETGLPSGPQNQQTEKANLPSGPGTVGQPQTGEPGAEKVRASINVHSLPHSSIPHDIRSTMNKRSLSPLMPDSFKSIIYRFVKLGPHRKFIKFRLCVDTGSYFNVLPLALVEKMGMTMSLNHSGLSATDVNGGDLSIKGVVSMVVLVGDGSRKRVSFIVCELPPGKEPLLNVETSMALGALSHSSLNGTTARGGNTRSRT